MEQSIVPIESPQNIESSAKTQLLLEALQQLQDPQAITVNFDQGNSRKGDYRFICLDTNDSIGEPVEIAIWKTHDRNQVNPSKYNFVCITFKREEIGRVLYVNRIDGANFQASKDETPSATSLRVWEQQAGIDVLPLHPKNLTNEDLNELLSWIQHSRRNDTRMQIARSNLQDPVTGGIHVVDTIQTNPSLPNPTIESTKK